MVTIFTTNLLLVAISRLLIAFSLFYIISTFRKNIITLDYFGKVFLFMLFFIALYLLSDSMVDFNILYYHLSKTDGLADSVFYQLLITFRNLFILSASFFSVLIHFDLKRMVLNEETSQ